MSMGTEGRQSAYGRCYYSSNMDPTISTKVSPCSLVPSPSYYHYQGQTPQSHQLPRTHLPETPRVSVSHPPIIIHWLPIRPVPILSRLRPGRLTHGPILYVCIFPSPPTSSPCFTPAKIPLGQFFRYGALNMVGPLPLTVTRILT